MARDGENLFRRTGQRFWYFKYRGVDGKYHEQSTGREKKSEARFVRDEEMARYRAGQTPTDMKSWTLKRAIEEHLAVRKIQRPKSARLERTCLNSVLQIMGPEKRLDKITALDLERYQVQRLMMKKKKGKGPISGSTVNLELMYLSNILKRANLWSKICANYKRLPKNKSTVGQAISQAQFVDLIRAARANPAWLVAFCAAVLSACGTGQRGVEIKKLRLENIRISDDEAWIVILRDAAKTDAGCREIPLNGVARWALLRLLERAKLAGASEPWHFLLPKDRSKHTRRDDPHKGENGIRSYRASVYLAECLGECLQEGWASGPTFP